MAAAPPVPLLPRLTSWSVSDHSWTTQQSGLTLLTRQSPAPCSSPSDVFSHHACVQTVAASLKAAPCFLCLLLPSPPPSLKVAGRARSAVEGQTGGCEVQGQSQQQSESLSNRHGYLIPRIVGGGGGGGLNLRRHFC